MKFTKLPIFFGILAVSLIALATYFFITRKNEKPNIIIILVDTLRADHLSYNGYERKTSPVLDQFATESLNYRYAFAASSWTAPSVASLLTGLYPSVHGMMPPNSRIKAAQKFSFRLSNELQMLPEILSDHGYITAGASANPWIGEQFGYTQGFKYLYSPGHLIAEEINQKIYRIFNKVFKKDSPFFLYAHYFDPHDPYLAPEGYKNFFQGDINDNRYNQNMQKLIRDYNDEIRYVDKKIGELFDYLKANGHYDNSLIIFTSDHGEQFKERGNRGHGYTLYNEEANIPLLIKLPHAKKGQLIEDPVSLVDIFPTILEIIGASKPYKIDGLSLLSEFKIRQKTGFLTEVTRRKNFKAYIDPSKHKFIAEYNLSDGLYVAPVETKSEKLFNFSSDYKETNSISTNPDFDNFAKKYHQATNSLQAESKRFKVDTMEMNPETLEQLKTLGYF